MADVVTGPVELDVDSADVLPAEDVSELVVALADVLTVPTLDDVVTGEIVSERDDDSVDELTAEVDILEDVDTGVLVSEPEVETREVDTLDDVEAPDEVGVLKVEAAELLVVEPLNVIVVKLERAVPEDDGGLPNEDCEV